MRNSRFFERKAKQKGLNILDYILYDFLLLVAEALAGRVEDLLERDFLLILLGGF